MTKAIAVQCKAISKQTGKQCKRKSSLVAKSVATTEEAPRQVKVKAASRAEVMNWSLGDSIVDPGEVLLRLVTQSAARAQRYASELEQPGRRWSPGRSNGRRDRDTDEARRLQGRRVHQRSRSARSTGT
jgi:hypothetical protein